MGEKFNLLTVFDLRQNILGAKNFITNAAGINNQRSVCFAGNFSHYLCNHKVIIVEIKMVDKVQMMGVNCLKLHKKRAL